MLTSIQLNCDKNQRILVRVEATSAVFGTDDDHWPIRNWTERFIVSLFCAFRRYIETISFKVPFVYRQAINECLAIGSPRNQTIHLVHSKDVYHFY